MPKYTEPAEEYDQYVIAGDFETYRVSKEEAQAIIDGREEISAGTQLVVRHVSIGKWRRLYPIESLPGDLDNIM